MQFCEEISSRAYLEDIMHKQHKAVEPEQMKEEKKVSQKKQLILHKKEV